MRTCKVLVIDDETDWRSCLHMALGSKGIDSKTVPSAQIAIECLEKGQEKFDLIILDLMLPGDKNGWEFLDWKMHSNFKHIPVMICSGYGSLELPLPKCVKKILVKPAENIMEEVKELLAH